MHKQEDTIHQESQIDEYRREEDGEKSTETQGPAPAHSWSVLLIHHIHHSLNGPSTHQVPQARTSPYELGLLWGSSSRVKPAVASSSLGQPPNSLVSPQGLAKTHPCPVHCHLNTER